MSPSVVKLRNTRRTLVGIVVMLAIAGCASSRAANRPYTAHDLITGREVSTAAFRGDPVLLVSWATWCSECRTELPALEKYYARGTPKDLRIVLVNVNNTNNHNEISDAVTQYHLTMPVWRDPDNDFEGHYGTVGVPTAVLLNRQGRVVRVFPGAINPSGTDLTNALAQT